MDFSKVKSITIPEGKVKSITCGGVVLWKVPENKKNWVLYSTEADGKTIYNGGKGYKDGYRVRSAGAEAEQFFTTITGYIPYRKGDKMYIYPPFRGENTSNTVNFYNDEFACLGQTTDSGNLHGICTAAFRPTVINGVSVLDLSAATVSGVNDIAYVRIGNLIGRGETGQSPISSGAEMVITMDQQPYRNWLPLSTDADGNDFVGTNAGGGDGYESGYRIAPSNGEQFAASGIFCSGFMPIKSINDQIRVKNITLSGTATYNAIVLYDSSKSRIFGSAFEKSGYAWAKLEGDTWRFIINQMTGNTSVAFFRFSCGGITDKTIVTVNEEIV